MTRTAEADQNILEEEVAIADEDIWKANEVHSPRRKPPMLNWTDILSLRKTLMSLSLNASLCPEEVLKDSVVELQTDYGIDPRTHNLMSCYKPIDFDVKTVDGQPEASPLSIENSTTGYV